jgi:peptidoglycan/LPS O-acetylase OafA/YrhL
MDSIKLPIKNNHFFWLDWLRFMAALVVVISHTRGAAYIEYGSLANIEKTHIVTGLYALTRIANEAVVIFFVLSGFLVGGRAFERMVNGSFRSVDYAIDRIVRIFLPLIPALILTAIINYGIDGEVNVFDFIGNLLSLQGVFVKPFGGNGPLWSLSYEVWFYVLVYAIGIASVKNYSHLPILGLMILVFLIFTCLDTTYLFCWIIGAAAYVLMPIRQSLIVIYLSFAIAIYSIIAIQIGYDSKSISIDWIRSYMLPLNAARIVLATAVALIIQQLILMRPKTVFLIKINNYGVSLAAFSYTLYLTHYPVLKLLSHLGLQRATVIDVYTLTIFIFVVMLCVLIGWILYFMFERHTHYFRNYLKNIVNSM